MCHVMYQTSNQRLDPSKVIIVPTAPCIEIKDLADPGKSSTFEEQYRNFWYVSISSVEMGRLMWPDYPAFKKMVERSEEHTSELQSLMRISYAVFCLTKKNQNTTINRNT